jgi:hypothetical protein
MAAATTPAAASADGDDGPVECDLGKKEHWDAEFSAALETFRDSGDAGVCWFEDQLGRKLLDLFDDADGWPADVRVRCAVARRHHVSCVHVCASVGVELLVLVGVVCGGRVTDVVRHIVANAGGPAA